MCWIIPHWCANSVCSPGACCKVNSWQLTSIWPITFTVYSKLQWSQILWKEGGRRCTVRKMSPAHFFRRATNVQNYICLLKLPGYLLYISIIIKWHTYVMMINNNAKKGFMLDFNDYSIINHTVRKSIRIHLRNVSNCSTLNLNEIKFWISPWFPPSILFNCHHPQVLQIPRSPYFSVFVLPKHVCGLTAWQLERKGKRKPWRGRWKSGELGGDEVFQRWKERERNPIFTE